MQQWSEGLWCGACAVWLAGLNGDPAELRGASVGLELGARAHGLPCFSRGVRCRGSSAWHASGGPAAHHGKGHHAPTGLNQTLPAWPALPQVGALPDVRAGRTLPRPLRSAGWVLCSSCCLRASFTLAVSGAGCRAVRVGV